MSQCRDCHLPMRWVRMEDSGKAMPVDPIPDRTGTVAAKPTKGADGKAQLVGYVISADRPLRADEGYRLHRHHAALCAEIRGAQPLRHRSITAGSDQPDRLFRNQKGTTMSKLRTRAGVIAAGLTLTGAVAMIATPAQAGAVPTEICNYAGIRVVVDYDLGNGTDEGPYGGINAGQCTPVGKDPDAFRSAHKRCVIVTNPFESKQNGGWYTKANKWYPVSSASFVSVFAYGSPIQGKQCNPTKELPPKA